MVTNNTNPNSADSDGEKIVVGIDGSTGAHAAIDWALSHAQANDQIEIIHTWTDPAMPAEIGMAFDPQIFADSAAAVLDAEMELIRERNSDIQIEGRCIRGHPGSALIEAAKDADLLVVGTRGHGGFVGLLLGSTSTYLAHHATCPLLIVPSDDRPAEENYTTHQPASRNEVGSGLFGYADAIAVSTHWPILAAGNAPTWRPTSMPW